jgi:hypothetical protein
VATRSEWSREAVLRPWSHTQYTAAASSLVRHSTVVDHGVIGSCRPAKARRVRPRVLGLVCWAPPISTWHVPPGMASGDVSTASRCYSRAEIQNASVRSSRLAHSIRLSNTRLRGLARASIWLALIVRRDRVSGCDCSLVHSHIIVHSRQ